MGYNLPTLFKKYCIALISSLIIILNANAQFSIDTTLTPTQYINNLVGTGVSFSNIQFQGDGQAVGLFNYGGANLGFSQGIMLSTGQASTADDAINNQTFGFLDFGLTNIPELADFVPGCFTPGATNDGIILQFDFIPQSTPISFKYIFASEEYNEYVCSQFNDAFAFLISGPGIVGEQNLAVVPGSGDPITINTINNGSVGLSGTATNDPCVTTNSAYFNMAPPNDIVFDGYTKVMTAVANVTPCQTYTLRLMLADGCDNSFDSAVFLEANSFGAAPIAISQTTYYGDTTTYEGCAPATLEFTINAALPNDYTFPFTLSGSATNGVDYATLPNSITIPAGQTTASLTLTALVDDIIEGEEIITIEYFTICGSVTTSVFITEKPLVTISSGPSQSICSGSGAVTLTSSAIGGLRPFSYSCLNGNPIEINDSTFSVNPNTTTTYILQVSDFCGTIDTAQVTVYVSSTPQPPLINDTISTCVGFPLIMESTTSADFYTWSGPAFLPNLSVNSPDSVFTIPLASLNDAGNHALTVTIEGCESSPSFFEVIVIDGSFLPSMNINSPVCENDSIFLRTTTLSNIEYHWSGPNGYISNSNSDTLFSAIESFEGLYELYVVIGACTSGVNQSNIVVNQIPVADAGVDLDLCSMELGQLGVASQPGYSYTWTPSVGLNSDLISNPTIEIGNLDPGITDYVYTLQVESLGCFKDTFTTVHVTANPVASFVSPEPACFENNMFDFQAGGIYNANNAEFLWEFGNWADVATSTDKNPINIHFNATGLQFVTLKITELTCTSNVYTALVNVLKMPVANFSSSVTESCNPSLVKFDNLSENDNYPFNSEWSLSNGQTSIELNPYVVFNDPGIFDVTLKVTGANGCSNLYAVPGAVQINPRPESNFNVNPIITSIYDPEFTITDYSNLADSCRYAMGNGDTISGFDAIYMYPDTGSYVITQLLSNEFGCYDTSFTNVRIDNGYKLFIPSSFSPNEDGLNDRFNVYGEDIYEFSMVIFNRWGQLLYRTYDIENGWDGTTQLSSTLVKNDVYLYEIKLKDKIGNNRTFKGNVTILR